MIELNQIKISFVYHTIQKITLTQFPIRIMIQMNRFQQSMCRSIEPSSSIQMQSGALYHLHNYYSSLDFNI